MVGVLRRGMVRSSPRDLRAPASRAASVTRTGTRCTACPFEQRSLRAVGSREHPQPQLCWPGGGVLVVPPERDRPARGSSDSLLREDGRRVGCEEGICKQRRRHVRGGELPAVAYDGSLQWSRAFRRHRDASEHRQLDGSGNRSHTARAAGARQDMSGSSSMLRSPASP